MAGLLAGKVALVTGGVRRIGRAIALALADEGASIVINARSSLDEAKDAAAEVAKKGGKSKAILADVTDESQVAAMVAEIVKEFGRLDILINNAGIRKDSPLTEISLADWRAVMGVVLDGAFLCS